MFYDRFIELCKMKEIKPTPLVVGMGLSSSNVSQWKKGSTPRAEVVAKLADYFGVSVEYMMGGTDEIKPDTVSDDEFRFKEYIEKLSALNPENRAIAFAQLDFLIDRQEKQDK